MDIFSCFRGEPQDQVKKLVNGLVDRNSSNYTKSDLKTLNKAVKIFKDAKGNRGWDNDVKDKVFKASMAVVDSTYKLEDVELKGLLNKSTSELQNSRFTYSHILHECKKIIKALENEVEISGGVLSKESTEKLESVEALLKKINGSIDLKYRNVFRRVLSRAYNIQDWCKSSEGILQELKARVSEVQRKSKLIPDAIKVFSDYKGTDYDQINDLFKTALYWLSYLLTEDLQKQYLDELKQIAIEEGKMLRSDVNEILIDYKQKSGLSKIFSPSAEEILLGESERLQFNIDNYLKCAGFKPNPLLLIKGCKDFLSLVENNLKDNINSVSSDVVEAALKKVITLCKARIPCGLRVRFFTLIGDFLQKTQSTGLFPELRQETLSIKQLYADKFNQIFFGMQKDFGKNLSSGVQTVPFDKQGLEFVFTASGGSVQTMEIFFKEFFGLIGKEGKFSLGERLGFLETVYDFLEQLNKDLELPFQDQKTECFGLLGNLRNQVREAQPKAAAEAQPKAAEEARRKAAVQLRWSAVEEVERHLTDDDNKYFIENWKYILRLCIDAPATENRLWQQVFLKFSPICEHLEVSDETIVEIVKVLLTFFNRPLCQDNLAQDIPRRYRAVLQAMNDTTVQFRDFCRELNKGIQLCSECGISLSNEKVKKLSLVSTEKDAENAYHQLSKKLHPNSKKKQVSSLDKDKNKKLDEYYSKINAVKSDFFSGEKELYR